MHKINLYLKKLWMGDVRVAIMHVVPIIFMHIIIPRLCIAMQYILANFKLMMGIMFANYTRKVWTNPSYSTRRKEAAASR